MVNLLEQRKIAVPGTPLYNLWLRITKSLDPSFLKANSTRATKPVSCFKRFKS